MNSDMQSTCKTDRSTKRAMGYLLLGGLLIALGLSGANRPEANPSAIRSTFGESLATQLQAKPVLQGAATRRIEDIRVGMRVLGTNPKRDDAEDSPEPTAELWHRVDLEMVKDNGKRLEISLIRSWDWLEDFEVEVGSDIELDLVEFGAVGFAKVTAVGPCPRIEQGGGHVVTGTFAHEPEDNLINVRIAGLEEPIGCTPGHRFWSPSRQNFVAAGDLLPGDEVHTRLAGVQRVACVSPRAYEHRVYNLEVHNEHVFEVSDLGVLVHNGCVKPTKVKGLTADKVNRLNREGYRNYYLQVKVNGKWKTYYHGYIRPGEGKQAIINRHSGVIGKDNLPRFVDNKLTEFRFQFVKGERTYGQARLMEHRRINSSTNPTNIGRSGSATNPTGSARGNRQNGLKPANFELYKLWEAALKNLN